MKYIYETHLHTCEASACGVSPGAEYPEVFKELGYAGFFVTDHFFNGNCAIPKSLPWEKRVELYARGYEAAKEEGDRIGIQVFFGIEDNFDGDEYLIYGVDKNWLLDNPDMLSWDHITHLKKVHEAGGIVIQAHPFRERGYLSKINLHPYQCDGWEAFNYGNPAYQDIPAWRYAHDKGMIMTAGSDIHDAANAGCDKCFGVEFDEPVKDEKDFARKILKGRHRLHVPDKRITSGPVPGQTELPIYLFNEYNKAENVELGDLIWPRERAKVLFK